MRELLVIGSCVVITVIISLYIALGDKVKIINLKTEDKISSKELSKNINLL